MLFKNVSLILFSLLAVLPVMAQDTCPALVEEALNFVSETCAAIDRNQACYGNIHVRATARADVTDFKFDTPGDLESVTSIQLLNLTPMSLPDEWGVMLMSIQANIPDALPGQNVALVLFGEGQIENRGGTSAAVLLEATASGNVRVRSGPSTDNGQVGALSGGDVVTADGRNDDGSWLRVQLGDSTVGWVSAELVTVNGAIATLPAVEGTEIAGTTYGPMQAFTFSSGLGAAHCAEAPKDGLLIQTPDGAGEIDLLINEVRIQLGSTALVRSQPDAFMTVAIIEGQGVVTAAGTSVTVPAGAQAAIPTDANGLAAGPPVVSPYTDADTAGLPLALLPDTIQTAAPLTVVEPQSGIWLVERENPFTCGGIVGDVAEEVNVTFTETGFVMDTDNFDLTEITEIPKTGFNTYSAAVESVFSFAVVYTAVTPTSLVGTWESSSPACGTQSASMTMTYQGS